MVLRTNDNILKQVDLLLMGKHEVDAKKILDYSKAQYRITRRDQSYFVLTRDYNPHRINLEIDEGVVTGVSRG